MLENIFGNQQGNYDSATMLMDLLSMGFVQILIATTLKNML